MIWRAFRTIAGLEDSLRGAHAENEQGRAARQRALDTNCDRIAGVLRRDAPALDGVVDFLVGEILRSQSHRDAEMKRVLTPLDAGARRAALRAKSPEFLSHLVSANYAMTIERVQQVAVAIQGEEDQAELAAALGLVGAGEVQYQARRVAAEADAPIAQLVADHFNAMLASYAGVVATPRYYLRSVDMSVYADVLQREIEMYRRSDLVLGGFARVNLPQTRQAEQAALDPLAPALAPPVQVFHEGRHYEHAVLNPAAPAAPLAPVEDQGQQQAPQGLAQAPQGLAQAPRSGGDVTMDTSSSSS
jgi:hypothetical protein